MMESSPHGSGLTRIVVWVGILSFLLGIGFGFGATFHYLRSSARRGNLFGVNGNGFLIRNLDTGEELLFEKNGELRAKAGLEEAVPWLTRVEDYHPGGTLKWQRFVFTSPDQGDILVGPEREWYASGQRKHEVFRAFASSWGLQQRWHENGKLSKMGVWSSPTTGYALTYSEAGGLTNVLVVCEGVAAEVAIDLGGAVENVRCFRDYPTKQQHLLRSSASEEEGE